MVFNACLTPPANTVSQFGCSIVQDDMVTGIAVIPR